MSENTGTTNFCPHVPPGEPPCAACRGDDFCTACGGHVAYNDSGLCASCLIAALYRKLAAQAAEIERLKASNAELRASADEAQTARLAAVAEAAFMRRALQAIRDYAFCPESDTVNADYMTIEELLAGAGSQAMAALERDAGAALLERLAKLEAALKPFAAYATDGLRVTADDWQRAADALKGDGAE